MSDVPFQQKLTVLKILKQKFEFNFPIPSNGQSNNVDASFLGVVDGESSGVAAIYVETSSGNNEIIIIPGKNTMRV